MRRVIRFFLYFLAIFFLILLFGFPFWFQCKLRPVDAGRTAARDFDINQGETSSQVAKNLEQQGLIRDSRVFLLYLTIHDLRAKVQAGSYSLSPAKSAKDTAEIISRGEVNASRLIIPEGTTNQKIAKLAAKRGIKEEDMKAAMQQTGYDFSFLAAKPSNVDLEGYLFPDSYQVTKSTTADSLVKAMLTNFGRQVKPEDVQAFAAQGFSLHQALTLASIIEKEVSNPQDRPIVAQIFISRLKAGQPLQSDVTVHYVADKLGIPFNTNIDSPFNTYKNKGLPPGPICNPGLSAMQAVAHPANTNYLYFVAGRDGKTHFARTFAEHQANVAKFLK